MSNHSSEELIELWIICEMMKSTLCYRRYSFLLTLSIFVGMKLAQKSHQWGNPVPLCASNDKEDDETSFPQDAK